LICKEGERKGVKKRPQRGGVKKTVLHENKIKNKKRKKKKRGGGGGGGGGGEVLIWM